MEYSINAAVSDLLPNRRIEGTLLVGTAVHSLCALLGKEVDRPSIAPTPQSSKAKPPMEFMSVDINPIF